MADKKISQLTGATTPLAGTEVLPVVQSGSTVKVAVSDLTAGRAVTASTLGAGTTVPANYTMATNGPLYFSSASFPGVPSAGTGAAYGSAANGLVFWGNGATYDLLIGNKNADECLSVATGQRAVKFWDNVVVGTAAKGIDFSANTGAAGETSSLLDWYEEGTWTPVLRFGGASTGITYTTQAGTYTRIGRTVTIRFEILLSNKGSSSGEADITGLPFNAANLNALSVYLYSGFDATYKAGIAYLNAGTINEIAADGTAAFSDAQFTNTSRFWGTCTYQV